jgi:hypothetical protein
MPATAPFFYLQFYLVKMRSPLTVKQKSDRQLIVNDYQLSIQNCDRPLNLHSELQAS